MKKMLTMLIPAFLIFSLGAAPIFNAGALAERNYPQAPDFSVSDLNGNTFTLADFRGKVLFVNFWATWCPPCREEIPDFVEFYAAEKGNGVEILGISLDTRGKDALVSFVEKYKINYPVVLESRRATEKLVYDFEPGQFIPTTIIIDKQGRIRNKHVGPLNKALLKRYFDQLAAE